MNLPVGVDFHLFVAHMGGHNGNMRLDDGWLDVSWMYFNAGIYHNWRFMLGGNCDVWADNWVVLNWSDGDTWVDLRSWHIRGVNCDVRPKVGISWLCNRGNVNVGLDINWMRVYRSRHDINVRVNLNCACFFMCCVHFDGRMNGNLGSRDMFDMVVLGNGDMEYVNLFVVLILMVNDAMGLVVVMGIVVMRNIILPVSPVVGINSWVYSSMMNKMMVGPLSQVG